MNQEEQVAANLEFCLLGPLLVRRGGGVVPVPPGKQRTLLAVLLLNANTVVPMEELAEALWGLKPPPSARASLQNHVMRLRKSLGAEGHSRVISHSGGYQITVGPGELDIDRFESHMATARADMRAGQHADAAAALRMALSLWRGQPLAGVRSEMLALREIPRLEEMRLQALEARIDADVKAGRHAEVIIELRQAAAVNPLRERLHALLMLALYRNGQQAGALAAYQAAREVLVSELGCEPGPELRRLQQQILAADPELAAGWGSAWALGATARPSGAAEPGIVRPGSAAPRQLPQAVRHFTGRSAELAALSGIQGQTDRPASAVVICAVAGTAGVGKTALAVFWAHQAAARFPDGQLYLNLRGFGPSGPPTTPAQAVRTLLESLGVAVERIPADPDAEAAMYRSLVADKRMLIVLDNAHDPAQVRPLLPGSGRSLVLVTSRNDFTGLAASDGAHLLTLDVLSEPNARQLLVGHLGEDRVAAEPAAAAELAGLCARLPLALSIVAARAAARPDVPLAAIAFGLRDGRTRLDWLSTGEAATDVRTVFSWSVEQLTEPAARMFRLLGVHPGPDITVPAAASLAGVPISQARAALAELARAYLLTEHVPGRYACHDLLHAYAADQACSYDSEAAQHAGLRRVLDHYLHTAYRAAQLLHPGRNQITLQPPLAQVLPEELGDRTQALGWFQAERQALVAAISRTATADAEFSAYTWQLAWAVTPFLWWHGYWHELEATQKLSLGALRQCGDRTREVHALRLLALARTRLGDHVGAGAHLSEALDAATRLGQVVQALVHTDMAAVMDTQGRTQEAIGHAERAMHLYEAASDRLGQAKALANLGWHHTRHGWYRQAIRHCEQALALHHELGSLGQPQVEAGILHNLGYAHHHLGHYIKAITFYQRALEIDCEPGDLHVPAEILTHLGDSYLAAGRNSAARHTWQQAVNLLNPTDPAIDGLRSRLGSPERAPNDQGPLRAIPLPELRWLTRSL